jgi:heptosyltransferase-2
VLTISWRGELLKRGLLRHDARRLHAAGGDVAILLPNSFASAWLIRRAGIAERWGYGTDVRSRLLTRAVARPKGSRHQGAYYQHLVAQLGIGNGPLAPQLRGGEEACEWATALLRQRGWDGSAPLIALAPGAAYGRAKQWLPSHVVSLVEMLTRDGSTCVLVGSAGDRSTTEQIRAALPREAAAATIDLAGVTTLGQLAAVLTLSKACISNDSGAMHVAAALGTPVIALFGPTIENETRPLTAPGGWSRVITNPVWCRPCMLRECPLDHRCMSGIAPEMVAAALGEVPSAPVTAEAGR